MVRCRQIVRVKRRVIASCKASVHAEGSCNYSMLKYACMFAEAGLGSNGSACQMLQMFKQPGYLKKHTTLIILVVPHVDTLSWSLIQRTLNIKL